MIDKLLPGASSTFGWVIRFVERFPKNAYIQLKWIWSKAKPLYKKLERMHVQQLGTQPHAATKFLYGFLILIAFVVPCAFVLVFIWALIKSLT